MLSSGDHVELKRFGKLSAVSKQKTVYVREGTKYRTRHRLHAAALMPMAAAFRELLVLKGDRYRWRMKPAEIFPVCAPQLYKALLYRMSKLRQVSHLGSDMEYWGACSQIVMRSLLDQSSD